VLISKENECFIPNGGTILAAGDQVLVLADKKDIPTIRLLIESRQDPEK
jgi:Trk K+ transport system NAD-binding subunit